MQKNITKSFETRYDWVGSVIDTELSKNLKFEYATKWYMHKYKFDLASETYKIIWKFGLNDQTLC